MSAVVSLITTLLPKILDYIPNANDRAKAQHEIMQEAMQFEQQMAQQQLEITKVEAESEEFFKYGPRPAALWVCVVGLAYTVFYPVLAWACLLVGVPTPPEVDQTVTTPLLFALLGLGTMRTFEKVNGVPSTTTKSTTSAPRRLFP